jgi:hypothetical protein
MAQYSRNSTDAQDAASDCRVKVSRIPRLGRTLAVALLAVLSCEHGETTGPGAVPRVVGVALVTFSNVTTPAMSASVLLADGVDDLETRMAGGLAGAQPLQLDLLSAGVFTRRSSTVKMRYVRATFGVQNPTGSIVFDATRENLSFIAAATSLTIPETPVRIFLKGDQQAASATLARLLSPTQLLTAGADGDLVTLASDVLRQLSDAELRNFPLLASTQAVFPYAFVVRRAPADGLLAGVVTFAFQIPDAASPSENPNMIGVLFLLVDDGGVNAASVP